jgi:salicylate hydroxylase
LLKAAVIGGGIGGLTAAVVLLQAGFDVHVYEQAPELTEPFDVTLNFPPNILRLLNGSLPSRVHVR